MLPHSHQVVVLWGKTIEKTFYSLPKDLDTKYRITNFVTAPKISHREIE